MGRWLERAAGWNTGEADAGLAFGSSPVCWTVLFQLQRRVGYELGQRSRRRVCGRIPPDYCDYWRRRREVHVQR
jgi:hypothetical protein